MQHCSWMDINFGSASITIDQITIPAATVARATVTSLVGFFKVRLHLNNPLNIDGEDVSFVKLKFHLDSGIPALLHKLLGHKVEMDQRQRGSRSEAIKVPGSTAAASPWPWRCQPFLPQCVQYLRILPSRGGFSRNHLSLMLTRRSVLTRLQG